jgi:hypothetical protein
MSVTEPAWQFFAALQDEADPQSIDRSLAREEALDAVLDEIVSDPAPDQNLLRKRFYSLCRNRLSKQTNRRMMDRGRAKATHRRGGTDFGRMLLTAPEPTVLDQLAYAQFAELIRTVLHAEEFRLLLEIADGHSYADLAFDRNWTASSLKSKAFRVREKVRKSRVSTMLCQALRTVALPEVINRG